MLNGIVGWNLAKCGTQPFRMPPQVFFKDFGLIVFLSFFSMFIYLQRTRGGAEREGERESKQALCCQHRSQLRVRSYEPRDHDLSRNQELDTQLTEPPKGPWTDCFLVEGSEYRELMSRLAPGKNKEIEMKRRGDTSVT